MSKKRKEGYNYLLFDVSEGFEDLKRVAAPRDETIDKVAWETIFHLLPKDELEVFVCLYLGLKAKEIVKILNFKNIDSFYEMNRKLRKTYSKQKGKIFRYN